MLISQAEPTDDLDYVWCPERKNARNHRTVNPRNAGDPMRHIEAPQKARAIQGERRMPRRTPRKRLSNTPKTSRSCCPDRCSRGIPTQPPGETRTTAFALPSHASAPTTLRIG